jgi:preprotein translocase subunit Sec63
MDSMYDKLGDLLSNALESGEMALKKDPGSQKKEDRSSVVSGTKKIKAARILSAKKIIRKGEIIHAEQTAVFPDYILNSYKVLGIKTDATEDKIKNAYHEKLKMFHPDSNSSNETIQKIARQKTTELIEAYKLLSDWITKQR